MSEELIFPDWMEEFRGWWDDGIAKPVDIGYLCAMLAWKHKDDEMREKLAEAQSREKVLRDALFSIRDNFESDSCTIIASVASEAMALPSDDTALKAILMAERELCAKIADENARKDLQEHGETAGYGYIRADEAKVIAWQIRALGDEK